MDTQTQSFLEFSAMNDLVQLAADTRAAWLWSADGSMILWANAAGAAFFSAQNARELSGLTSLERSPARPHIARIAETGQTGKFSIDRLRFYKGLRVMLLTCQCKRVALEDGGSAALIVCTDKGLTLTRDPIPAFAQLLKGDGVTAYLMTGGRVDARYGALGSTPEDLDLPKGKRVLFGPLDLEGRFHDGAVLQIPAGPKVVVLSNTPLADNANVQFPEEMPEKDGKDAPAATAADDPAPAVTPLDATTGAVEAYKESPPVEPRKTSQDNAGALEGAEPEQQDTDLPSADESPDDSQDGDDAAAGTGEDTASEEPGMSVDTDAWADEDRGEIAGEDVSEDVPDWTSDDESHFEAADADAVDAHLPEGTTPDDLQDDVLAEDGRNASGEDTAGLETAKTDGQSAEEALDEDALPELTPVSTPETFVFQPRRRPVRFAWKMDMAQRFTFLSDEFADVLGPDATDIVGLTWEEVSGRFGLDPRGQIARALDRRDTWSGKTVDWPVSGAALRVPVDMAALPAFDRERRFEGYRGFGVCRTSDAVQDPDGFLPAPAASAATEDTDAALELADDGLFDPEETPGAEGRTDEDSAPGGKLLHGEAKTPADEQDSADQTPHELQPDEDLSADELEDPEGLPEDAFDDGAEGPAPDTAPAQARLEDLKPAQPNSLGGRTFLGASAAALVGSLAMFKGKKGSDPAGTEAGAPPPAPTPDTSSAEAPSFEDTSLSDDLRKAAAALDAAEDSESTFDDPADAVIDIENTAPDDAKDADGPKDNGPEAAAPHQDNDRLDDTDADNADEDGADEDGADEDGADEDGADEDGADEDEPGFTHENGSFIAEVSVPARRAKDREDTAAVSSAEPAPKADTAGIPTGITGSAELKPSEIESAVKSLAKSYKAAEKKSPDLFEAPDPVQPFNSPDSAPALDGADAHDGLDAEALSQSAGDIPDFSDDEAFLAAEVSTTPLLDTSFADYTEDTDEDRLDGAEADEEPDASDAEDGAVGGPVSGSTAQDNANAPDDGPPRSEEDVNAHEAEDTGLSVSDDEEREFFEETAAFEAEEQDAGDDGDTPLRDGAAVEREHGPVQKTGQVIPLATARPRVVPVDTSGLSRPERQVFRKIAEALGARLEGDLEDFDAPDSGADEDTPVLELPQEPAPEAGPIDPTLLDRLPIGISIVHDREVLYANKALLKMLGYPSISKLSEAGGLEALFIDDTDELADAVGVDGEVDEALKMRLADGGVLNVDAHMHSVPWNGTRGLMISITERPSNPAQPMAAPAAPNFFAEVRAELDSARNQISEMETILETATDGVLVLDRHGTILKVNGSAEALFSASRTDMIGAPLTLFLAPESHRAASDYLDGLSRNGVASILNDGREVLGQVPAGGIIPLFMTMGRITSRDEEAKYCAVLRDITQWKSAEEELTEAKRQAENANSQKSDFLAKISHEIRTPLNAIIGFSEVMMEERFGPIGNDRYKDYLKDIRTSGSHIMSLINDLLDLSKIEAGKLDMNFTAVSSNDVINECVALMQPQANRDRVIIRTSLPDTMPDVVADPRSLRQIVLNLLSNAIKYNKSGGQVILSTVLESNGEVALRVRDTGTGMTAKQLTAALEPFRQLHTSSRGGGTGLGLPLTKALVEANRASFHIDSTPDQGTLVEIIFPTQRVLSE